MSDYQSLIEMNQLASAHVEEMLEHMFKTYNVSEHDAQLMRSQLLHVTNNNGLLLDMIVVSEKNALEETQKRREAQAEANDLREILDNLLHWMENAGNEDIQERYPKYQRYFEAFYNNLRVQVQQDVEKREFDFSIQFFADTIARNNDLAFEEAQDLLDVLMHGNEDQKRYMLQSVFLDMYHLKQREMLEE